MPSGCEFQRRCSQAASSAPATAIRWMVALANGRRAQSSLHITTASFLLLLELENNLHRVLHLLSRSSYPDGIRHILGRLSVSAFHLRGSLLNWRTLSRFLPFQHCTTRQHLGDSNRMRQYSSALVIDPSWLEEPSEVC